MAHRVIRNLNDTFKRLEAGESILVPVSPNGYPDLNRIHRTTTVIPSSAMVRAAKRHLLSLPAPTIEEAPSSSTTSEEKPLVSGNTTTADACDDKLSVEIRDVPNVTSSSPSSTGEVPEMTSFSASSTQPSQRTRMMLTPWQSEALKRQFALHPYPDTATKAALALRLGLDSQWISRWFNRRRYVTRQKLKTAKRIVPSLTPSWPTASRTRHDQDLTARSYSGALQHREVTTRSYPFYTAGYHTFSGGWSDDSGDYTGGNGHLALTDWNRPTTDFHHDVSSTGSYGSFPLPSASIGMAPLHSTPVKTPTQPGVHVPIPVKREVTLVIGNN